MVQRRKQSGSLMAKLGKKGSDAFKTHGSDETKVSAGGDLPAGIDGGIAQLVECKFDTYKKGDNKGKPYFIAYGVIKEPSVVGNIPVRGRNTQIMEPICETPKRSRKTVDEHIAWILNELRKLGVDTNDVDENSIDTLLEVLKEEQPHFQFRTWKGEPTKEFPKPRVQETWGTCCDYVEEEEDSVDEEVEEEEEEEEESSKDEKESVDLPLLGKLADKGNDDANIQLTELAEEAGVDTDDYESWADVAKALIGSSETETTEEEEEEITPEKGDVFNYKPPKKRKAIECEVTAVFKGKKTCNLKNLDTGLSYKRVAWTSLVEID